MAYTGPLHFAIGNHDIDVPLYCGAPGSNGIPYLAYNHVTQLWALVAAPGGGGGNTLVLAAADRSNVRAAEKEARAAMNADGTLPL